MVILRTVANVKDLVEHHGLTLVGTRTPRFYCFYSSSHVPRGMPSRVQSSSSSSSSSESSDPILCVTKDEEKQQWSREPVVVYNKRVPVLDWSATPAYIYNAISPQMIKWWKEGIINLRNIYARNLFTAKDALEMVEYVDWMTDIEPAPFTWLEEGQLRFIKESAVREMDAEPELKEPTFASRRIYTNVSDYQRSKVSYSTMYSVDQTVAVKAESGNQRFWLATIIERCRRQDRDQEVDDYRVSWLDADVEFGSYSQHMIRVNIPAHKRRAGSKTRTKSHQLVPAEDIISGATILCKVVLNKKGKGAKQGKTIRASSQNDILTALDLWIGSTESASRQVSNDGDRDASDEDVVIDDPDDVARLEEIEEGMAKQKKKRGRPRKSRAPAPIARKAKSSASKRRGRPRRRHSSDDEDDDDEEKQQHDDGDDDVGEEEADEEDDEGEEHDEEQEE